MDAAVTSAAQHLLAGKYFQIAPATVFVYDHRGEGLDASQIRCISALLPQSLWDVNAAYYRTRFRMYLCTNGSTIASLGNCFRCDKYVLFEGVSTVIVVAGLRTGFGCILTGSDSLSPSLWIASLVTDSFIFLLTIYRTKENIGHLVTSIMNGGASDRVVTILLRDGLMYYFLIFLANLMNCLIFFIAEPDIKPIGASFSQLLTCIMISRLVLNLRSLSDVNSNHAKEITAIQFNNQHTTVSTQPETKDNNSITLEIGHPAFDGASLEQVERMRDLNDKKGHSLHSP
ncbi:hypothetical protein AGABI2DRAFT_177474 [Agaricus bisporus var. bisporus H97]|uniref:hypothetical protein n=1 Tax=Agaricus bisporus var. bisporus (strain H97 / ATCC MYA-4626 / FGSC 10389) TaxID=936046 RepID=UPI00029F5286|nr:hypothetical protein AGABI2DRAFT_177474 [Agaricus bisporus var. bisporus H97]EKV49521.1 hypothetical protein AGABI2DRAFT_177474 [Agaricus bisporus var. bisporus H97]